MSNSPATPTQPIVVHPPLRMCPDHLRAALAAARRQGQYDVVAWERARGWPLAANDLLAAIERGDLP